MFLTRKGYHTLVIAWLGLMIVIDVIANTVFTGVMSELYFWKILLDGVLIWWTAAYLKEDMAGNVLSSGQAAVEKARLARQANLRGDESVVGTIESLSAIEYIYYFFLLAYGGANFIFHHAINKSSTGPLSITTLVLSAVDGVILVVAAINLWNMYSGNVVRFSKSLISEQK